MVCFRRTVAANHLNWLMYFEPIAQAAEHIEHAGIHRPDIAAIMVAQYPINVAHHLADVMAIGPVHLAKTLARMHVVERDRSWGEGNGWRWLDRGNAGCNRGDTENTA